MQDFDAALKLLLRRGARRALASLCGIEIQQWLDVELPQVRNPRVDLLGKTADGGMVQIELQSTHDGLMAVRMAEYALAIRRIYGQIPRQVVLYVGQAPLRMASRFEERGLAFHFDMVDARELDGAALLASAEIEDNLVAILARLRDHKEAVRQVLVRIARLPSGQREDAYTLLLLLAGLRRLDQVVKEEAESMPVIIDLAENAVLGPPYKRGLAEGKAEGKAEGRSEEAATVVTRLIEKKFGAMPLWAQARLKSKSTAELESLAERLLDVTALAELLAE